MDDILTYVRKKISCPQFGDDHYGEWGALPLRQRKIIKRLLDYSVGQEEVINRQKAEIERLQSGITEQHNAICEIVKQTKSEAIKEFAERLKKEFSLLRRECRNVLDNDGVFAIDRARKKVDNLVKEMVGDSDAR